MTDISKIGFRLNAVTGPKVNAPAVNPYYGFLQTYSLIGDSATWYGHLKKYRDAIYNPVLHESDIEAPLNKKQQNVKETL